MLPSMAAIVVLEGLGWYNPFCFCKFFFEIFCFCILMAVMVLYAGDLYMLLLENRYILEKQNWIRLTLNRHNDLSFEPVTTCKLPSVSVPVTTLFKLVCFQSTWQDTIANGTKIISNEPVKHTTLLHNVYLTIDTVYLQNKRETL
jgi:hypothetical protein